MATLESGAQLSASVRDALRDLILVLADSKRVLGMRYAQWILGAPELEAGIACASMAQDEWGHARLLYAMLREFGEDVERLEHERPAAEYRNMEVLDRAPHIWPELVALNALADTALTVQLDVLRGSSHVPLKKQVEKILEEEHFHERHGAAWLRRLASGGRKARPAITQAVTAVVPPVLRWLGPDSARARALTESGAASLAGTALRDRYLQRVAALLDDIAEVDAFRGEPPWHGFDEATRRVARGGPDDETLAKIRGDKNRAFLLD